ncbi:coiled-coil domain-containing protein [Mesonia aquimarina]|uniref:hypothetical protein n=1 Tax=Mesonia aquimarina TaxID=1504967 RepID=UPI000EF5B052|nr:hypothetical protein [Mesonia aquimarina]
MLKKNITLFCTLFFSLINLYAQNQEEQIQTEDSSINGQFTELIEEANNYQDYKVVKQVRLERLQKNTISEINSLNDEIEEANNTIQQQKKQVEKLSQELSNTKNKLTEANQQKEEINFLGIATDKTTYQSIMWLIVLGLVLILIFFIYKYKSSNAQTKEAKKRLQDAEEDYDDFRKKSLEKQQRLGRMLQDEKNKQSKNGNQP